MVCRFEVGVASLDCRPTHLFLGTQQDNIRDMDKKGRRNPPTGDRSWARLHPEKLRRGADNNKTKLTVQQVLEIRSSFDPFAKRGRGTKKWLSECFLVSRFNIAAILSRKTWSHIP